MWFPNPKFVYSRVNKNGKKPKIKVMFKKKMSSKEKFFQWLESQESVSHNDIIVKLVKLGEVEEAKTQLNNLKNNHITIVGEKVSLYEMALGTLPKKIVKSLVA